MANLTTQERLVKLETLMEQALTEIKEVRSDLKTLSDSFVAKSIYDEDITSLRTEIDRLNSKRWIQNTLSAILGTILTLLIGFFITHVGK